MKTAHPVALACAIAACLPSASFALGIRLADQDARATARGNAFTATADNPSAIYYNPAGISQLYAPKLSLGVGTSKTAVPSEQDGEGGFRLRMGLYSITISSEARPLGAASSYNTSDRWQVAPNFFATWKQPNSKFTFGLGVYSPYGFGIWYPENNPYRQLAISGSIKYITINPVVSYQVTDTLSIAAGPTFNYAKSSLKNGLALANSFFEFEGEGWGVGGNAGILWKPHPKHSFGVMYRSETWVTYDGHSNTFIPNLLSSRENASALMVFPQNVVIGYSYRPTPKWNLEFNLDWTDWDKLNTVTLRQASGNVPLTFNWQSSFFYEFGASYQFDNGLTASAGYIYSENSVPNASFNPVVPDSDRHIFTFGLGKQWGNWDFDIAYQYAYGPSRTVTSLAAGTYQFDSHAISVSAGYRF